MMLPLRASATLSGCVDTDIGIAVAVAAGPEAHVDDGVVFGDGFRELVLHEAQDPARCIVKDIFQVPAQAHGLIIWRGLGFVQKWRFAKLLQVHVDQAGIVVGQRL